ncbi:MAG TPA: acetylglutamate kinase [Elusimicrobiales bacterium]|nr:acetylglutamate kinase [Elusimicrobiales bacterium]
MRLVVKIGGAAIDDAPTLKKCAAAAAALAAQGHSLAVVHGGGAALTRTLAQLGREAKFINGLRVTDAATRDVALMVLAGQVNKKLVAALSAEGPAAIGLCGGDGRAFTARKITPKGADLGFVGEIVSVDPRWIEALWGAGGVPVISSLALGADNEYYNVNADQMAAACAAGCKAEALIFLTDVPGVKGAAGTVLPRLSAAEIPAMEAAGVIKGGMLPKLQACRDALKGGVGRVRILPSARADLLPGFETGKTDGGTEVTL